eukprot:TRINITY_DN25467_c0_g3_i2.p1 TRINITY_DN25467_c0_g3~~TRINITY_DN25467_c0_g3_i2.p1  ORF type:complete len:400 (-),score=105.91 TRINITY_DN25467_c0_g3_i2:159-1277(-)
MAAANVDIEMEVEQPMAQSSGEDEIGIVRDAQQRSLKRLAAVSAVAFAAAVGLSCAAYASVRGPSAKVLTIEEQRAILGLASSTTGGTNNLLYDDCGQQAYCATNANDGMQAQFCRVIAGKTCPCTICCNMFPHMLGCVPNSGDGQLGTIVGPDKAAGLVQGTNGGIKISCFPGEAQVQSRRGAFAIEELKIGDEVLAERSDGTLAFERVLTFLHKVPAARGSPFVSVLHEAGEFRISAKHVVFVESPAGRVDKFAEDLLPGDLLLAVSLAEMRQPSRVLSLHSSKLARGWYAPMTPSGTIVVDGVLASNYANVEAHKAAHASFFLARAFYAITAALPAAAFGREELPSTADAMHPLASALRIFEPLLPAAK